MCFCQSARLFISVTVDMVVFLSLWTEVRGEGGRVVEKAVVGKFCVEKFGGPRGAQKKPRHGVINRGAQGVGFCQPVERP